MNSIAEANLQNAAQAYAVANTPLFLIRRLQEDSTVQEIATSFSGEEILAELQRSAARAPESLLDYTRPYVYLIALAKQQNSDCLRAAGAVETKDWRWFSYMKDVLLETYSPLSTTSVLGEIARMSPSYSTLTRSESPALRITVGE